MRTFVLYACKGKTDENFSLESLPSSGGRMDLVARFITSTMFISHKMRQDTRVFVVLNGEPNPPVTIEISPIVRKIGVDERSVGLWIKKLLAELGTGKAVQMYNGLKAERKSFQKLIKELSADNKIFILHENGKNFSKFKFPENSVFVIGDHLGLPDKEKKYASRFGKKLSLGKTIYLASSCVSLIHWIIDTSQ
jgi:tRNA (pseudouridine54-N1)-methyltransferase